MLFALGPFLLVHLAALHVAEAYDFNRLRSESDLAFSACAGVLLGGLLCFLLSSVYIVYYLPDVQVIGRSVFLVAGAANLVLLPGWRVWARRQRQRRGELRARVLLVGTPDGVDLLRSELAEYVAEGHEIAGAVHTDDPGTDAIGTLDTLPEILAAHRISEVILAGDGLTHDAAGLLRIVEQCDAAGATVHLVPGYYEALVGRLDLYAFGGLPAIGLRRDPLPPGYASVKRTLDLVVAAAGLVLLSPVLLIAALAVRLDSKGPAFYRQDRVGRDGRVFRILKLRSMRVDAEAETGPVFAEKDDPRVTRVGRFLRDKRLDELPQLWNVLLGDMSLVGPRPERPHFLVEFSKTVPLFPLRLRVRPGLTSLSHVWGRYDSTPSHRLLYDLTYMNNLGFMLDLRILVDTVKIVLTGRGAR
jgi:exopolysaccharide biosynthesis polyprenyl glycosylphosphotransferase